MDDFGYKEKTPYGGNADSLSGQPLPASKDISSAYSRLRRRRRGEPASVQPQKQQSPISIREFKYKLENSPDALIPGTAGKRYTKSQLKDIAGEIEAENKKLGRWNMLQEQDKDKIVKSFEKKMYAAPRGTPERLELEHKWKFVKKYLKK